MGTESIELVNVAVIGSTSLTFKLLCVLEDIQRPKYIFGLPDDMLPKKVNSLPLDDFCNSKGIVLDKSNDWNSFRHHCEKLDIDTILEFGDSRIIPNFITSGYQIIGNHGAVLPCIQGAASLVWGRLLNNGQWGVTLFEINEKIDSGDILCVSRFEYDTAMTMKEFVEIADNLTLDLFMRIINEGYTRSKNSKWNIRISKGSDTFLAVKFLKEALQMNANIYMPSRSPIDGKLKKNWSLQFQKTFKLANNYPYPKWH